MDYKDQVHKKYQELLETHPDFFQNQHGVSYITDPHQIFEWEQKTGEVIGVHHESQYEIMIVDLIKKDGKLKSHGRIILPDGGVVIIPRVEDKFVLENQYRYPLCQSFLAFPRGHREPNSTPEEDAAREVEEELGGATIHNLRCLGKTYPETHSDAWYCSVWAGEIDQKSLSLIKGYEGIDELVLLTEAEIDTKIASGEISCGYTLAAWSLYRASKLV
ncbi:NUDIX hydrolase [Candidatus Saccharibacteria bacterium]|nr:NUDIX hydrolase [Candidatus Saccharibacteria bacterium]